MSKDMKLIMERWDRFVIEEDVSKPKTWGELGQNILLNMAATKWPKMGKTLARLGFTLATGVAKQAFDAIESAEDILDFIPDEWQAKIEQGTDEAVNWLRKTAKNAGGQIGAFIVDDVIGMDDSLTKNVVGFDQLNLEDEYEKLVDKNILKKWATTVIRYAKENANSDEPLPDLNRELELWLQKQTGAHPDTDEPDIRQGQQ